MALRLYLAGRRSNTLHSLGQSDNELANWNDAPGKFEPMSIGRANVRDCLFWLPRPL